MACMSLGFRALASQIPMAIASSSSFSPKRTTAVCRSTVRAAAMIPQMPPLNPKDPFLSKLASIAAANPDLVQMPQPDSDIPPFLDLFDSPKLMAMPAQLVPAVTEVVIAELLYLQWMNPNQTIYLYINSTGTTHDDGEIVAE